MQRNGGEGEKERKIVGRDRDDGRAEIGPEMGTDACERAIVLTIAGKDRV